MSITVWSKDYCPYCAKIKTVFEQRSITFTEQVLDVDFVADEFYSEFGVDATFPQVVIDGEKIGGASDTVRHLVENGMI
tara:strand:- start:392 stop:628 length:237 start_codon:yes stop_codon:yes gene_type:complete